MVDDAIKFVAEKSKENLRSSGNNNEVDKEESNEPDYDEERDQLEEKQTGEMAATINHVF